MSTFEPTAPESAAQSSILPSQPVDIVPRGVLWSLAAIPLGMVVAVVLWRPGFIASISSFLIAAVGVFLYTKGAGTTPKRGIVPVGAVILVGVVASFFAIVAADLVEYYGPRRARRWATRARCSSSPATCSTPTC